MIDADFAARFATDWIAAWNRHDLDALLDRCTDDLEWTSPLLPRLARASSGALRGEARGRRLLGKAADGARADARAPAALHRAAHPERSGQPGAAELRRPADHCADLRLSGGWPRRQTRHSPRQLNKEPR